MNLNTFSSKAQNQDFYIFKNIEVHILLNENMPQNTKIYRDQIKQMFIETNKIYLNRTGNTVSWSLMQTNGLPNFMFKDINIKLHFGAKRVYKDNASELREIADYIKKTDSDKNVLHLVFVEALEFSEEAFAGRILRGKALCNKCTIPSEINVGIEMTVYSWNRLTTDDKGRYGKPGITIAHELGHYFNLSHPFGSYICSDADHIVDTPKARELFWYTQDNKPDGDIIDNPCKRAIRCLGSRRLVENVMDYGPCRFMFTPMQVMAMQGFVEGKRSSLYEKINRDPQSVNPEDITVNIEAAWYVCK